MQRFQRARIPWVVGALGLALPSGRPPGGSPMSSDVADAAAPQDTGGPFPDVGRDVAPDLAVDAAPEDVPLPPDGGGDVPLDTAGAAPDTGPLPEELIGQFNVTWWSPDVFSPWPEVYVHGVFSRVLAAAGLEDPVGWLDGGMSYDVYVDEGYWWLPALGAWTPIEADPWDNWEPAGAIDSLDAGLTVSFGDVLSTHVDELLLAREGFSVYETERDDGVANAERLPPDSVLPLAIDGGADVSAAQMEGAVALAAPIEMVSPDPLLPLALRHGQRLVFSWVPSPAPDDTVLLAAHGEQGG